jgi:hypothetical protein
MIVVQCTKMLVAELKYRYQRCSQALISRFMADMHIYLYANGINAF